MSSKDKKRKRCCHKFERKGNHCGVCPLAQLMQQQSSSQRDTAEGSSVSGADVITLVGRGNPEPVLSTLREVS
jgi:hypothetical protein